MGQFLMSSTPYLVSSAALWVVVLTLAVLVLLLYRHFGLMALGTLEGVERDGLAIGDHAPPLNGITAAGEDVRLSPGESRPSFLFFAAPGCAPCEKVLPVLNQFVGLDGATPEIDVVTVVRGSMGNVQEVEETHRPPYLAFAEDESRAFEQYRVRVTPFAFVVGDDGLVRAKGLCSDPRRFASLLTAAGLDASAARAVQAEERLVALQEKDGQPTEVEVLR
jgi:methylamine dehydrogenase accessory protein MauD